MAHVLVIDDSTAERERVRTLLVANEHSLSFVSDATEALEKLDHSVPDALLINVSMSEFDAEEFIRTVRAKRARVPIVLMSSQGDEKSVIESLQMGASSYVPRDVLEQELPSTLGDVLAYSREQDCQFRMLAQMCELRCQFQLENDRSLIPPLVGYLQDHMGRMGICDEADLVRIGIALDEALVNALQHGNLELDSDLREQGDAFYALAQERMQQSPYADRCLHVAVHLTKDLAEIVIHDEGPGFDVAALPDPRDPTNMDKVSGRGILLMRTFMDEVEFNDVGNKVTLRKRRNVSPD